METPVAERLRRLGVDVEFLLFLEGAEDRLAQLGRIGEIAEAQFLAAVRAAVWLCSQAPEPHDRVATEEWIRRYERLQGFLWNAIRYSMIAHRLDRPMDLEALEKVLDKLLPRAASEQIRRDILMLREKGKPERLSDLAPNYRAPRSGGRRQSEQVQRMRAAVAHLRKTSTRPYRDLADLWNEHLREIRYAPDQIRQLLRKGPESGEHLLELWRKCYEGDYRAIFPGELPETDVLASKNRDS